MIYDNRDKIEDKYLIKFNKLVEKLKKQGYEFDYNEVCGEFQFKKYIFNEVEKIQEISEIISVQDELNKNGDATDWKKAYNNLKKYI